MTTNQPAETFNAMWNRYYVPTGGAEKVYLLIEAKGAGTARAAARAPVNLSLVLDRSGSMSGASLAYSKSACGFALDQMNAGDVLSMVAFDDEVQTIVKPGAVTDKEQIKRMIRTVETGGCTNLSGGLIEGAQHVRKHGKQGIVNRVILLSDGHANQGITDRSQLAAIAKEYRNAGVGITAMGVGDDFDEELMEAIAEAGGGNYYYIDTPDRIPSIFRQELQGLLTVVGQNGKLTLRPTPAARVTRVYGYKSEALANGDHMIWVGDLYQEETKSILIELALRPHSRGVHPVLTLQWEYVDITEGAAACSQYSEIQAEFTNDLELLSLPSRKEVQMQVELAHSAGTIEAAIEALDRGDLHTGTQLLQEQAEHMQNMSEALAAPCLAMESEKLLSRLNDFEYTSKARKQLFEQKHRYMTRK